MTGSGKIVPPSRDECRLSYEKETGIPFVELPVMAAWNTVRTRGDMGHTGPPVSGRHGTRGTRTDPGTRLDVVAGTHAFLDGLALRGLKADLAEAARSGERGRLCEVVDGVGTPGLLHNLLLRQLGEQVVGAALNGSRCALVGEGRWVARVCSERE